MGLHTPLEELARWFDRDHFALVCTEQRSYTGGTYSTVTVITGVVTRVDLLSFIATKGGESPVPNVRTVAFSQWYRNHPGKDRGRMLLDGIRPALTLSATLSLCLFIKDCV